MKAIKHISEIFQRRPPDWQMRKKYRPEDFKRVVHPDLIEIHDMIEQGDLSKVKARIDTKPENPFFYIIKDHKRKRVMGRENWQDTPLFEFNSHWSMHSEQCAFEYQDAKDGLQCHQIQYSIDGTEEIYDRLLIPHGDEVIVASVLLA